jgi:hypothetical protein
MKIYIPTKMVMAPSYAKNYVSLSKCDNVIEKFKCNMQ